MKKSIINFLRALFPFFATVFLWRLSAPVWNPAGILAIIPIFYCTFVRPVPWFAPFGVLFCFLIDYNFDTVLFWTATYCMVYAAYGFQTIVEISRMNRHGIHAFMAYFGICTIILFLTHISATNLLRSGWMFIWATILYIPITEIIRRLSRD